MPAVQGNWTSLVDRRPFIPDLIYTWGGPGEWLVPLRRQDNPRRWEELVASGEAIATKLKPVTRADGTEFPMWPCSSSSAPRVMNAMIGALDLEPGMSVLEIGTGTGWNAAVLAAAGAVVTTIEIDPDIAGHARAALARAGYPDVVVVTGDGELGVPSRAPFDRVLATAAAHVVPYAWVEQCREGGRIVFPYTGPLCKDALAILSVAGGIARGEADPQTEAAFMPLCGQGLSQAELQAIGDQRNVVLIEVGPHGQTVTRAPGEPRDLCGQVRAICMALPDVSERLSHGAPTWFVRGRKAFVTLWADGHHDHDFAHLWCAGLPGAQRELIAAEPGQFFRPPYVGGRGWIGVRLDRGLDWSEIAGLCQDAYRVVATTRPGGPPR